MAAALLGRQELQFLEGAQNKHRRTWKKLHKIRLNKTKQERGEHLDPNQLAALQEESSLQAQLELLMKLLPAAAVALQHDMETARGEQAISEPSSPPAAMEVEPGITFLSAMEVDGLNESPTEPEAIEGPKIGGRLKLLHQVGMHEMVTFSVQAELMSPLYANKVDTDPATQCTFIRGHAAKYTDATVDFEDPPGNDLTTYFGHKFKVPKAKLALHQNSAFCHMRLTAAATARPMTIYLRSLAPNQRSKDYVASHLCSSPGCFRLGHVIFETYAMNESRKWCQEGTFPCPACSHPIPRCQHQPACIFGAQARPHHRMYV